MICKFTAVVACCALLGFSSSQAAIILEDSYLLGSDPSAGQYVVDTTINGKNPTLTGFSTANWVGAGDQFGNYLPATETLTYGPLLTSGGRLNYIRTSTANQSQKPMGRTSSDTTDRNTYYASFLLNAASNANGANPDYNVVGLQFGTNPVILFGLRDSNPFLGTGSQAAIDIFNDTDTYGSITTGTALSSPFNTTHLFVLKVVGSGTGNESVSLFVDPDISTLGTEPGTPTITLSTNLLSDGSGSALSKAWWISNSSANSSIMQFDELRVGTTWADVVPIPEPSTYCLAGFAAAGIWWARRKR